MNIGNNRLRLFGTACERVVGRQNEVLFSLSPQLKKRYIRELGEIHGGLWKDTKISSSYIYLISLVRKRDKAISSISIRETKLFAVRISIGYRCAHGLNCTGKRRSEKLECNRVARVLNTSKMYVVYRWDICERFRLVFWSLTFYDCYCVINKKLQLRMWLLFALRTVKTVYKNVSRNNVTS